jgi:hypothetical protein
MNSAPARKTNASAVVSRKTFPTFPAIPGKWGNRGKKGMTTASTEVGGQHSPVRCQPKFSHEGLRTEASADDWLASSDMTFSSPASIRSPCVRPSANAKPVEEKGEHQTLPKLIDDELFNRLPRSEISRVGGASFHTGFRSLSLWEWIFLDMAVSARTGPLGKRFWI